MFRCGDQITYGPHGVCTIIAIENMQMGRKTAEYYILEPLDQPTARYYVPTQNEAAVAKLRPIITQQELTDILNCAETCSDLWSKDDNQRKQIYRDLLAGGDRAALVQTVHMLHKRKAEQAAAGRKLHLCDENFLRDAERLLGTEFSLVLNIDHNEVGKYVQSILDAQ